MTKLKFVGRDELIQVNPDDIVCFKAEGNYTRMVLVSGQVQLLTMNLSKVQLILVQQLAIDAALFDRVGRDLVLRRSYIFSLNVLQQKITLIAPNGKKFIEEVSKDAIKKLKLRQESHTSSTRAVAQLREVVSGKTYQLCIGLNRFGRKSSSTQCEHQIDNGDGKISREHFRIEVLQNSETDKMEYFISDCQSANGTYLKSLRIDTENPVVLSFGDIIKAGNTEFVFDRIDFEKTEIF